MVDNPENNPNLKRLTGYVTRIARTTDNRSKNTVFWTFSTTSKKEYKCVGPEFCPLSPGDVIQVLVEVRSGHGNVYGNHLYLIHRPFVQLSVSKNDIIKCFLKMLSGTGFGNKKAYNLYDRLVEIVKSLNKDNDKEDALGIIDDFDANLDDDYGSQVSSFLSELSALYCDNKDKNLLGSLLTVIKESQADRLMFRWHKHRNLRRLWLLGLNNREIAESKMSFQELYDACISNPFKVLSLSMKKAKEIFYQIGKQYNKKDERCGIIGRRIFQYSEDQAWSCVPMGIVGSEFPDIFDHLDMLCDEYGLVIDNVTQSVYLSYQYLVETEIAEFIKEKIKNNNNNNKEDDDSLFKDPTFSTTKLTDEQKKAIAGALNNDISIITGSAGTGKTTIIGQLIYNCEMLDVQYQVASFTGKATARLRQVIRRKSPATLDKLIMGGNKNKKPFKVLIIDEVSMVTSELMYRFIKACGTDYKIILVGDPYQLEPISWGSFFMALINAKNDNGSYKIPIYELTINHRSDADGIECGIIKNASVIREKMVEKDKIRSKKIRNSAVFFEEEEKKFSFDDFSLQEINNFFLQNGEIHTVRDVLAFLKDNGVKNKDVTILCPYKKFLDILNDFHHDIFIPHTREVRDSWGNTWKVGGRVMMTENDYDINIMNGEEGLVIDLTTTEIIVDFSGAQYRFLLEKPDRFSYEKDDHLLTVQKLTPCGAVTIHKSQGSEWEYVVVFLPPDIDGGSFLNSKLIYTAITRPRLYMWVIGNIDKINTQATRDPAYRHDNLIKRI